MSDDLKTYEVRVRHQITRRVVCTRVEEKDGSVWFLGPDDLVVFKVDAEEVVWWQLKKPSGRRVGVKRNLRAAPTAWAFGIGRAAGKRE